MAKTRKQKRKHNRNLSEAALGELLVTIKYKADWYSRGCTEVGKYFASTKICHCCGHKLEDKLDTKVRSWTCPGCGAELDRDGNAAINIRNEGMRIRASNN